jgi:hypothetical protein
LCRVLVEVDRRFRDSYCIHHQSDTVQLPEGCHLHTRSSENLKSLFETNCEFRVYHCYFLFPSYLLISQWYIPLTLTSIITLHFAHIICLWVSYFSQNKQRLFLQTALTNWSL